MKRSKKALLFGLSLALITIPALSLHTKAANTDKFSASTKYYSKDKDGRYVFKLQSSTSKNTTALKALLNNNAKKTIVIPSGTTVHINSAIYIGSNTTLIATGATIIQDENAKGCIRNAPDCAEETIKYNTLENVTIDGGLWKNENNTATHSLFRLSHGSDIVIKNAEIRTNYKSHGIEFIACKDSTVKNCTVKAYNTSTLSSSSVEEAIQIDIATPSTAPGVYSEAKNFSTINNKNYDKYVAGQTCRNITISGCTIRGSRGVCANYCTRDNGKWKKYYHRDITIKKCTISGRASEAIALFNVAGFTIRENKIVCKGTRNNCYTDGLHVVNMATAKTIAKKENLVYKNKIYGYFNGIAMNSQTSRKLGPTKIKSNRVYCKKGKVACLNISTGKFVKLTLKSNKLYNWK